MKVKVKFKKLCNFCQTVLGDIVLKTGIIISYIPIMYANDIGIVKGFTAFALLFFVLHMFLPNDRNEIILNKYKKFLNKEIKNNKELSYLKDKLISLEKEN